MQLLQRIILFLVSDFLGQNCQKHIHEMVIISWWIFRLASDMLYPHTFSTDPAAMCPENGWGGKWGKK